MANNYVLLRLPFKPLGIFFWPKSSIYIEGFIFVHLVLNSRCTNQIELGLKCVKKLCEPSSHAFLLLLLSY